MKKITVTHSFIGLIAAAMLFQSCQSQIPHIEYTSHDFTDSTAYRNPVISGFNPDPSICRVDDDYYLVTSSFEYFPGVPVYHSTDLVNWEQVGNALTRESQLQLHGLKPSEGIFAPTIRHHEGVFYMITTNVPSGTNLLVTTTDPTGPWSEPVIIPSKNIDPSLYFDDDGSVYYTGTAPWDGSETGIYQALIDVSTGELLSDYRLIWKGTGGRYPEGPHLYKMDGWYYLMISEGGTETGHFVTIARSENPFGPFEECPHNPILTNRNQPYSNPVQNSGHADLVRAPDGKWWMVHLAVRNINKHHHLGRETFLLPVEWTSDGWPLVNRDGISRIEIMAVPPAPQTKSPATIKYDFTRPLGPEWLWLRNPEFSDYQVDTTSGQLKIRGTGNRLDHLASPSFTGLRQQYLEQEIIAELSAELVSDGDEAGLAVYMNNEHYYTISRIRQDGRELIRMAMQIGTIRHVVNDVPAPPEKCFLKIVADPVMYRFFWSENGTEWKFLGENYARLLSSETAGGFTGVITGMFAQTTTKDHSIRATFDRLIISGK